MERDSLIDRLPGGAALPAAGLGLLAAAAAAAVHRSGPATTTAVLIQTWVLAAATLASAGFLARRSPFSRSFYLAGAAILGVSLILGALLLKDPAFWAPEVRQIGFYQWFYVTFLGLMPHQGPRWCSSGWVLLAVSLLLGPGQMILRSFLG